MHDSLTTEPSLAWADTISNNVQRPSNFSSDITPYFQTNRGVLFSGDCLKILPEIESESVDTVFADPPFNIGKTYGAKYNDNIPDDRYLAWCRDWIQESVRTLKPGGAFFCTIFQNGTYC